MKLTDNFTLEELIKSSTATKLNIDNNPTEEITSNLLELSTKILQPIRNVYGKPIVISSGYRCTKLIKAVGGEASSLSIKATYGYVDAPLGGDYFFRNVYIQYLILERDCTGDLPMGWGDGISDTDIYVKDNQVSVYSSYEHWSYAKHIYPISRFNTDHPEVANWWVYE